MRRSIAFITVCRENDGVDAPLVALAANYIPAWRGSRSDGSPEVRMTVVEHGFDQVRSAAELRLSYGL